jgi:hypothetical protein
MVEESTLEASVKSRSRTGPEAGWVTYVLGRSTQTLGQMLVPAT